MRQNVTLKNIQEFIDEIDRAASDKSRTISDISNSKLKKLICSGAAVAINTGAFGITAASLGLQSGATIGGVAIGGAGGAGAAGVAGGTVIKSLAAGGAAASGAGAGAAAGNTFLPVIGAIIGAGVGLGVGIFAGRASAQKQATEKERLYQEIISKQNIVNIQLKSEVNKYKSAYYKSDQENERLKYILGILKINEELKKALA